MRADQYTNGAYLEKVKDWHVSDSPWKASNVFRMIEKHNLSPHSVYDIGCGAGQILVELQMKLDPTAKFFGYDISPQAIAIAKQKENDRLKFYNEDYLTAPAGPPDLVLLLDIFEHVRDFIGFLEGLREKSRWIIFHIPLDICAISVFRRSSYMLYMREAYGHLHHFTKETAIATLTGIGFEVVDFFYTDDYAMDSMIPLSIKPRMIYEVRKFLYRIKPDLSVSLFSHFNLMLLARGSCAANQ